MSVITDTQVCSVCKQEKPLSEYHRDRGNPNGYRYACKVCFMNKYRRGDENKAKQAEYMRNYRRATTKEVERRRAKRLKAIEALGGKCECCGETQIEFLAIDHINGHNGGRSGRSGEMLVDKVRKEGYPRDMYRVLCHNCNCSIGWYGYCPHKSDSNFLARDRVHK